MRGILYPARWVRLAFASSLVAAQIGSALAHGDPGDRFFPSTILTDDPFVADEMSLPTISVNPPSPDGSRELDIGIDLAKRITPDMGSRCRISGNVYRTRACPQSAAWVVPSTPSSIINFYRTRRIRQWRSSASMSAGGIPAGSRLSVPRTLRPFPR